MGVTRGPPVPSRWAVGASFVLSLLSIDLLLFGVVGFLDMLDIDGGQGMDLLLLAVAAVVVALSAAAFAIVSIARRWLTSLAVVALMLSLCVCGLAVVLVLLATIIHSIPTSSV